MPPCESDTVPVTVIVNLSKPLPGSPLSCTVTVKEQGVAPFAVHVPEKVALLPKMQTLVTEPCTFKPLAWFTYSSCPLGPPLVCALKPKLAKPAGPDTVAISPPPVVLPLTQTGVGVLLGVLVGVTVGVFVGVFVFVGVTVGVLVGVFVFVGVTVGVSVGV